MKKISASGRVPGTPAIDSQKVEEAMQELEQAAPNAVQAEPEERAPVPDALTKQNDSPDFVTSISAKLHDGRVLVMAVPMFPTHMVVPRCLDSNKEKRGDIQLMSDARSAKVVQYVRSIGGKQIPPSMEWMSVLAVLRELGEMGVLAMFQLYDLTWPDSGLVYWSEIKKNVLG